MLLRDGLDHSVGRTGDNVAVFLIDFFIESCPTEHVVKFAMRFGKKLRPKSIDVIFWDGDLTHHWFQTGGNGVQDVQVRSALFGE